MSSGRDWVAFFGDAGVPSSAAKTYAAAFVENRIRENMLEDLDKEYLRDMGITVLGDIICILKHSKKVIETKKAEISLKDHTIIAGTGSSSSSSGAAARKSTGSTGVGTGEDVARHRGKGKELDQQRGVAKVRPRPSASNYNSNTLRLIFAEIDGR